MAIGSISVRIGADITEFNKGIASMQKQLSASSKGLSTVAKSMTSVGDSLTKTVTIPLLAIGAALLKTGTEFDDAYDKIRTSTGKTGEAFKGLQDDFRAIAKDTPATFNDISTAVSVLESRLGLTGKPLQELSNTVLELSRVTGTDLTTNVNTAAQMFNNWNIATKDQTKTLDFMLKASQQTGVGITDLMSSVTSTGPILRAMGFDFETSTALLATFSKNGIEAGTATMALKIALKNMAAEGITDPQAALQKLIDQIKNAGTTTEALTIGMATFGARGAVPMVQAIREGKFSLDELVGSLNKSSDTIKQVAADTFDLKAAMQKLGNDAMLAIEPLATKLFETLIRSVEELKPKLEAVTAWFGTLSEAQMDNILKWGLILAVIPPVISGLGRAVTGVIQLKNAMLLLNTAFLASPVAIAAATVAAVGVYAAGIWIATGAIRAENQAIEDNIKLKETQATTIENNKVIAESAGTSMRAATKEDILLSGESAKTMDDESAALVTLVDNKYKNTDVTVESTQATVEEKIASQDNEAVLQSLMTRYTLTKEEAQKYAAEQGLLKTATDDTTESTDAQTQSVDDLIASLYQLYNLNQSVTEATWAYDDSLTNLTAVMANANSTEREKQTAIFGTQDALENLQIAMAKEYEDTTTSIERKKELANQYITTGLQAVASGTMSESAFASMAATFGIKSADIIAWADAMGIKLDYNTRQRFLYLNTDGAMRSAQEFQQALNNMHDKDITITTYYRSIGLGMEAASNAAAKAPVKKSMGGPVGFASGAFLSGMRDIQLPKFDNGGVLAMLHPPEVVLNGKQALNMVWNQAQQKEKGGKSTPSTINIYPETSIDLTSQSNIRIIKQAVAEVMNA